MRDIFRLELDSNSISAFAILAFHGVSVPGDVGGVDCEVDRATEGFNDTVSVPSGRFQDIRDRKGAHDIGQSRRRY